MPTFDAPHEFAIGSATDALPTIFDAIMLTRESLVRVVVSEYLTALSSHKEAYDGLSRIEYCD